MKTTQKIAIWAYIVIGLGLSCTVTDQHNVRCPSSPTSANDFGIIAVAWGVLLPAAGVAFLLGDKVDDCK